MINNIIKRTYLMLLLFALFSSMFSQVPPVIPGATALNNLFLDSGLPPIYGPFGPEAPVAPLSEWATAGSNALIDSLNWLEINITDIHAIVSLDPESSEIDTTYFDNAIPDDNIDDSAVFNELIEFLKTRSLNVADHIRIIIPPGVYNFSDQIEMHSNISLKGAGSDLTELRFLIKSDSIMTQADCRKDAIQIDGSSFTLEDRISYAAVCLLKGELK